MALRFLDSFDHYTSATQKWSTGNWVTSGGYARTGTYGIAPGANHYRTITLDNQDTWIVGLAARFATLWNNKAFMGIMDGASYQSQVIVQADGRLDLYVGGGFAARTTRFLRAGAWHYIEVKHIIANAGGTLELRVNGEVWATYAGDTQATANAYANTIRLNSAGQPYVYSVYVDDIYILDGTGGAPNNDYWGDCQIERSLPNGVGTYNEWASIVGAPTAHEATDEVPPSGAEYVGESLVNDRVTMAMGDITPANATINGLQVNIFCREDTAGAAHIARMLRHTAADDQGADFALNTSFAYWLREIMETDPIAVGPWTVANVNAAEFGARVR